MISTLSATSSPTISRISSGEFPRWVPVATRMTMSSRRITPSSASSTAGMTMWRGWARVPSHIEMATVAPGRSRSRSGGPVTGSRIARMTSWC